MYSNSYILLNFRTNKSFTITELLQSISLPMGDVVKISVYSSVTQLIHSVTWLAYTCDMTRPYMCDTLPICVTVLFCRTSCIFSYGSCCENLILQWVITHSLYDMTHLYVCHDTPIYMWHVTHIYVTCHPYICDMWPIYVWHPTHICGNTRMQDLLYLFLWVMLWKSLSRPRHRCHDSFIYMTYYIFGHDPFTYMAYHICVTWRIHRCEAAVQVPWLVHMYVWLDSFIHVTWLVRTCDVTCDVTCVTHMKEGRCGKDDGSQGWSTGAITHSYMCVIWLIHPRDMTRLYV